ncbi:MAG: xylulokinase [Kosmotogales bacterium]|nr:xylulokinase [Kosmotogales bacterium]
MKYYLGIDMGTSSIKACLIDEDGEILFNQTEKSILLNPEEGFFEVNPVESWWNGFKKICNKISKKYDLKKIKSICISSLCGTVVPVDDEFNPVYNAILYGIDTRSKNQAERLNEFYGEEKLKNELGGIFTTHSIIPKVLWLKENKPEIYSKSKYFLESNNFVSARLVEETAWDFPTAAGSRLVNLKTNELPYEIFDDFELDKNKFPKLKWPLDVLGKIKEKASKETGLSQDTTVFCGACDINAEAMASGAIDPGDLVVVYGSTVSTLLTTDRYITLSGFAPGMSLIEGTYRIGAPTSSGGRFLEWIDHFFEIENVDFEYEVPTNIIILPYLDGARAPFDNPEASGVFYGIRRTTSKNEIHQASRETLGYETYLLIKKMKKVYEEPKRINVLGGMAKNKKIMQLISDITGKELIIHNDIDASFGDAKIALTVDNSIAEINDLKGIKSIISKREIIRPDLKTHEKYMKMTEKYEDVYKDLFSTR